jgi:sulfate/thiosulfate transport system ATP-binding protein
VRPRSSLGVAEVAPPGEDDDVTVVLTRSHARELGLDVGTKVWLSANRGATTFPSLHAVG